MRVVRMFLVCVWLLGAGCEKRAANSAPTSVEAPAAPSVSLESRGSLVHDEAVSGFSESEVSDFGLEGEWTFRVGTSTRPGYRFSVFEGRLALDGPQGRFLGGRSSKDPAVLVLQQQSEDAGPPYVVIQSWVAEGPGRFRGVEQTRGGDEDAPRPVWLTRLP